MRDLTGKWIIKKRILCGYKIMVEVKTQNLCFITGTWSPCFKTWQKAREEDLIELNILNKKRK